jgi:hypothetical protein
MAMLGSLAGVALPLSRASALTFFEEFGSTGEVLSGPAISPSSSTTVLSQGGFVGVENGATALGTHVGFNVNADANPDLVAVEPGTLSFQVGFAIGHSHAFDVTIAVESHGQLRRSADNPGCQGAVSVSDITLPTLRRQSDGVLFPLDIVVTGGALEFGAGDATIDLNGEATRTVQFRNQEAGDDAYFIDFTVSATAISQSCEVSARFGADNGSTTDCGACVYPGDGERVRADDGISVAVILTDLCGNGTVDGGEECDLGSQNGRGDVCCDDACQFVQRRLCRPAVDDCDKPEACDGAAPTCPDDQRKTFGSACTDDQNVCTDDVCDNDSVCVHMPREGAACEDGLFCDGEEICSAQGQCAELIPPPCPRDRCDEATDSCLLVTLTPTATPTPVASGAATATPTATPPPGSTPTATRSAAPTSPGSCRGDCNTDGMVAINELVLGVNIALGSQPITACAAFDANADAAVAINELIAGVNNALAGCRP